MIGLLIQDNQYEQDIRELLMSFYPGEAYVHEVKDGADFYVETRLGDGAVSIYGKMQLPRRTAAEIRQGRRAAAGERPGRSRERSRRHHARRV